MARRREVPRRDDDEGMPQRFLDARPRLEDWATPEEIAAVANENEWLDLSVKCKRRQAEAMFEWGAERGMGKIDTLRLAKNTRLGRTDD